MNASDLELQTLYAMHDVIVVSLANKRFVCYNAAIVTISIACICGFYVL